MIKKSFIAPACFRWFYHEYKKRKFSLLDIGCGNHAVQKAKKWFPLCTYTGVDREIYNNDNADLALIDSFRKIDLQSLNALDSIPDGAYDIVLMVHVIEHLKNGEYVLERLVDKVKEGGGIYIEFPALNSLSLPSLEGTLNFCDDPTHVRLYNLCALSNILLDKGFRIVYAGKRRHPLLFVLSPLLILLGVIKNRKITAMGFWDLVHFSDCIYAVKRKSLNQG